MAGGSHARRRGERTGRDRRWLELTRHGPMFLELGIGGREKTMKQSYRSRSLAGTCARVFVLNVFGVVRVGCARSYVGRVEQ